MEFKPSITLYERTEPFELQVSRDLIDGHRSIFRSAYSDVLASPAVTMIWNLPRGYTFPASATVMTLSSSSTADTAQAVLVQGLDTNHNEISEVVLLNGQNPIGTMHSYLRINDLIVIDDGSVGNIYIGTGALTAGVPLNIYNFIFAGDNISKTAVYTVPAGYTLYLMNGSVSSFTVNVNKQVTVRFYSRNNGVRYLNSSLILTNGFQYFKYDPPVAIAEKTDLSDFATTTDTTSSVNVTFAGILIKNT